MRETTDGGPITEYQQKLDYDALDDQMTDLLIQPPQGIDRWSRDIVDVFGHLSRALVSCMSAESPASESIKVQGALIALTELQEAIERHKITEPPVVGALQASLIRARNELAAERGHGRGGGGRLGIAVLLLLSLNLPPV